MTVFISVVERYIMNMFICMNREFKQRKEVYKVDKTARVDKTISNL